jgi:hypothetical protein
MKNPTLGDYLLWEGKPAQIIGIIDEKSVSIEILEHKKCPHCGGDLGREVFSVIVSSPLFQENAEKIKTFK